jgi:hypothetical protein
VGAAAVNFIMTCCSCQWSGEFEVEGDSPTVIRMTGLRSIATNIAHERDNPGHRAHLRILR